MKVVIDTNSLLSLVRYYLPFDKKSILFDFFKSKIEEGEIIIIDKVYEECKYVAKGIILHKLNCLADDEFLKLSKLPLKTKDLLPPNPAEFLELMGNHFVNWTVRKQRKIDNVEFETLKNNQIEDADIRQIVLCLNLMQTDENVVLVTEETAGGNDNKLFKKIPAICKELGVKTMTLPELIEQYEEIELHFKSPNPVLSLF